MGEGSADVDGTGFTGAAEGTSLGSRAALAVGGLCSSVSGACVEEEAAAALFRASATACRIGEVLGVSGLGDVGAAGLRIGVCVWGGVSVVLAVGDGDGDGAGVRGKVVETVVLFPGPVRDAVDLVGGLVGEEVAFGVVGLGGGFRLAVVLVDRFWAAVVVVGAVVDAGEAEVLCGMSEVDGDIWVIFGGRPRLRVMEVAVVMLEVIV